MKCFWAPGWVHVFLICLTCIFGTDVKAQGLANGETLNNYELLTSVGNSLIEKVVKKSRLPTEKASVLLSASREDSINWFIEKRLSSYLINVGYEVAFIDSLSMVGCKNYVIQFNTIEIGIRYKADFKVDSKLQRTGFLTADFKIIDCQTNNVLLNDVIFESMTDWVDIAEKESLENRNIDVTVGEIDAGSPTVRFKPLIITAVTGTIVYLFYALRSR